MQILLAAMYSFSFVFTKKVSAKPIFVYIQRLLYYFSFFTCICFLFMVTKMNVLIVAFEHLRSVYEKEGYRALISTETTFLTITLIGLALVSLCLVLYQITAKPEAANS